MHGCTATWLRDDPDRNADRHAVAGGTASGAPGLPESQLRERALTSQMAWSAGSFGGARPASSRRRPGAAPRHRAAAVGFARDRRDRPCGREVRADLADDEPGERAALRRDAELVGQRGAALDEVFTAVAAERRSCWRELAAGRLARGRGRTAPMWPSPPARRCGRDAVLAGRHAHRKSWRPLPAHGSQRAGVWGHALTSGPHTDRHCRARHQRAPGAASPSWPPRPSRARPRVRPSGVADRPRRASSQVATTDGALAARRCTRLASSGSAAAPGLDPGRLSGSRCRRPDAGRGNREESDQLR